MSEAKFHEQLKEAKDFTMTSNDSLHKSKSKDFKKEQENNKEKKSSTDEELSNNEHLANEELFEPSVWKNSGTGKQLDFPNFSAKYELLKKEEINRRLKFKGKKWKEGSVDSNNTPPSKTPSKNSDENNKISRTGINEILNVDSIKSIPGGSKLFQSNLAKPKRNNSMANINNDKSWENILTAPERIFEKKHNSRALSNKSKYYQPLKKLVGKIDETNYSYNYNNIINNGYMNTNNFIMKNIHRNKNKIKDLQAMNTTSLLRNIRNNIISNKFRLEKEFNSKKNLQTNQTEVNNSSIQKLFLSSIKDKNKMAQKIFQRDNNNNQFYWPIYESKNLKEDEEDDNDNYADNNEIGSSNYKKEILQEFNPINSFKTENNFNNIDNRNNLNGLNCLNNLNENKIKEYTEGPKGNDIINNQTDEILHNFKSNKQVQNFNRTASMAQLTQINRNYINTSTINTEKSTNSNNNQQKCHGGELDENFSTQSFPIDLSSNRSNNSQNTHLTSSSFGKINSTLFYGPNCGRTLMASASCSAVNTLDCLPNAQKMKNLKNLNLNNISGCANSGTYFSGTHMMTSYLSTNSYTNTLSNESAASSNCLENYRSQKGFGQRVFCFPGIRSLYSRKVNTAKENKQRQNNNLNSTGLFNNKSNNSYNTKYAREQPKTVREFINLEDVALGKETRTTIMIRNIPIKYSESHLEMELNDFGNKYDCIYMPYDFEKKGNKGYAFINLVHPLHVLMFCEIFMGKSWKFFESKKICELNFAKFQGINEIKSIALSYDKIRKPNFYIITDGKNSEIEVPAKYLDLILMKYPKMDYVIKKQKNTVVINSLN